MVIGIAVLPQRVNDRLGAIFALRTQEPELFQKGRGVWVNVVCQQMDVKVVHSGRELDGGYQGKKRSPKGAQGLRQAGDGVVVCDRQDVDTAVQSKAHELRRAQRAVRGGGVDVKVRLHRT